MQPRMTSTFNALCWSACLFTMATPGTLQAQLRASERGMVVQQIDGTKITVDYSRPRARGRSPIYGAPMVSWGEMWTPGADSATTLLLSKDARIGGKDVAGGKYSVWVVVRKDETWTVVLDPKWEQFHTDHPDSTTTQIRFAVQPRAVSPVEVLTWFAWADSASTEKPSTLTIERRDGTLIGRWTPTQFGSLEEVMLVPMGDGQFAQGFMRNRELWAVYPESRWTFTRPAGRAERFEIQFDTTVTARGHR